MHSATDALAARRRLRHLKRGVQRTERGWRHPERGGYRLESFARRGGGRQSGGYLVIGVIG